MKRLIMTAVLVAVSWMPVAHSASIDMGSISGQATRWIPIFGPLEFHQVSFEVTADGPYQFSIADLNSGAGTFGGGLWTTDVLDLLGLDIRENLGGGVFGSVIGTGGFDQPLTSSASFIAHLEAGKQYIGLLLGQVANDANLGELSLNVSLVPIPPAAFLLLSAIGGVLIVRRRRSSQAPAA